MDKRIHLRCCGGCACAYPPYHYCAVAKRGVEIDGGWHADPTHHARVRRRDAGLAALGLRVLRFDNKQVLLETEAVPTVIHDAVAGRLPKQ